MEPSDHTTETLRGLVAELDDKLRGSRSTSRRPSSVPANEGGFPALVRELDDRLAPVRTSSIKNPDGIEIIEERRVPGWLGIVAVTLLGIAIGAAVVRPWHDRCSYGRDVCAIAEMDIDALRITIPDSELIATLPNIDAIDPHDELTTGDIFAMERFAHLNLAELLTDEDIDRLLGRAG